MLLRVGQRRFSQDAPGVIEDPSPLPGQLDRLSACPRAGGRLLGVHVHPRQNEKHEAHLGKKPKTDTQPACNSPGHDIFLFRDLVCSTRSTDTCPRTGPYSRGPDLRPRAMRRIKGQWRCPPSERSGAVGRPWTMAKSLPNTSNWRRFCCAVYFAEPDTAGCQGDRDRRVPGDPSSSAERRPRVLTGAKKAANRNFVSGTDYLCAASFRRKRARSAWAFPASGCRVLPYTSARALRNVSSQGTFGS